MVRRDRLLRSCALVLAVVAGAWGLQACNRSAQNAQSAAADSLPLTTAEQAPSAPAPSADALPAAAAAPVVRVANPGDDYAYLDQAYYEGDAFQDAPPDYAFDYDGVSPWAWQGDDGFEFAEPVADGFRYYYYLPGSAWPYLIRDGGYAYGFDGDQLVEVYDSQGRLLPRDQIDRRAGLAGRYLARSQGLLDASRQAGRRSVAAPNWTAARPRIAAQQAQLTAARSRDPAWQAYDQAHGPAEQARWRPEQDRRQQYAQRVQSWRQANFQGAAPAPVGPRGRSADVRQAQATLPARQAESRAAQPGPAPAHAPPSNALRDFAEQRPAARGQGRPPGEPPHAFAQARQTPPRQVPPQAAGPRQQAVQRRQPAAPARQFAQARPHPAPAAAPRQQAIQQRRPAAPPRQFAQAPPRPAPAAVLRRQQVAQHAPPPRPQAARPPPQQARQQRQPPHPAAPPAARPAAKDEHREQK